MYPSRRERTHPRFQSLPTRVYRAIGIFLIVLGTVLVIRQRYRSTNVNARSSISTSTDGVVVAYLIQASPTNAHQLVRLFGALCDQHTANKAVYALHLDASISNDDADQLIEQVQNVLLVHGCGESPLVLVPREHVTYRGITLTHNYLSGASALIQSRHHFDYFINLSGSDYPTVRTGVISELLTHSAPYRLSFFDWQQAEKWDRFGRGRLMRRFIDTALVAPEIRGSYYVPPDVPIPETEPEYLNPMYKHVWYQVAKSSGWFIWHRSLVEHFLLDGEARRTLATFAQSDASDEHYFATVVWNDDDLRQRTLPMNWRAVFFLAPNGSAPLAEDGITRSRQHPYYVDDVDDLGRLLFWDRLQSTPAFFTRKVRPNGLITDNIDRHLLGPGPLRTQYESALRNAFISAVQFQVQNEPDLNTDNRQYRSAFISNKVR